MAFAATLARQRRAARLSQAELAARAGLSQRHVSFLETGRARPGRRALAALVAALGLSAHQAGQLLAAAGVVAPPTASTWAAPGFAPLRAVVARLLAVHAPAPAYALDRSGRLLAGNGGLEVLLALTGRDLWAAVDRGQGRNIYDLTLHPDGLAGLMVEPARLVPAVMQRLRRAALVDAGAAATLARVELYPAVRRHSALGLAPGDMGVIPEVFRLGDRRLAFIAVTAVFGSADADASAGIEIESLFAADAATASHLGWPWP